MTWYAHHLFAEAVSPLLEKLLANPTLSQGIYWVRHLTDYPWHDSRVKHELSPHGLLVIRPICNPSSPEAKWYGNPVISWFDLKGKKTVKLNIPPRLLQKDNTASDASIYPPPAFLTYLKQLSSESKSLLAFYQCTMWGGDTDSEFAWIFEKGDEIAYSGVDFREFPNTIKEYRQNGELIERKGYVLVEALNHFSIHLPTPFFALHTRNFEWESARVKSPRLGAG